MRICSLRGCRLKHEWNQMVWSVNNLRCGTAANNAGFRAGSEFWRDLERDARISLHFSNSPKGESPLEATSKRAIARFEIALGCRTFWKQVPPPPARPGMKNVGVVITPDGKSYACTYSNHSSHLFLVQGLK